ncbi:MAG: hypothetical protein L6407_00115, partial [Candidatus Delongbacteria bacterium]|nr:hypothetical protein [Candidatus Delongbacteria bacterium]
MNFRIIVFLVFPILSSILLGQFSAELTDQNSSELEITGEEYMYPIYSPNYFEGFDVDTIKSKFFVTDKMLQFVDLHDYAGQDTSKVIDLATYKQILFQLEKAEVINTAYPDSISPYTNLIKKMDSQLSSISADKSVSEFSIPMDISIYYRTIAMFGRTFITVQFSSLPLKEKTFRGSEVTFNFNDDNINTNIGIQSLSVDFGEGYGYRGIQIGSSFSTNVLIRYNSIGIKNIKTRVKINNQYYYSNSSISVESLTIPDPTTILELTSDTPYKNGYETGKVYIYPSHLNNNQIRNPIIFVEGFDVFNNSNADELYNELRSEDLDITLKNEGYDIVILNFSNARTYIQRNAYLLIKVIEEINSRKVTNNELIVIGASMGGLVSRYALSYMESHNLNHNSRLFASFDSPQRGANIPIGIQYWLRFFASENDGAKYLLSKLCEPAAKQMLIWHLISDWPEELVIAAGVEPPSILRSELYDELSQNGNYPDFLKKIAISKGNAVADPLPSINDKLIYYHDN